MEFYYILDCLTKYCIEHNLDCFQNPYAYENLKMSNWTTEIDLDYRKEYFFNYVKNEPARKFASEVIHRLKQEGHKIYIITSRAYSTIEDEAGQSMRKSIKEWLKKNDIIYDDIYFSADKIIQIKELNIDVMIEDSPTTIPTFVHCTHIFCYDCRYNRELEDRNLTRVFSWYDIYKNINKFCTKE